MNPVATLEKLSVPKALIRGSGSQVYVGLTWKLCKSRPPGPTPGLMESESLGRDPAPAVVRVPKEGKGRIQRTGSDVIFYYYHQSCCCHISKETDLQFLLF